MASFTGVSITTPKGFANAGENSRPQSVKFSQLKYPWKRSAARRKLGPVAAAPDQISRNVKESIKNTQEACNEDSVSGECAAASHDRDKLIKDSDPLETYEFTSALLARLSMP
ncbi:hypothetical protein ACS0TY_013803 [Phlomoides rotata]